MNRLEEVGLLRARRLNRLVSCIFVNDDTHSGSKLIDCRSGELVFVAHCRKQLVNQSADVIFLRIHKGQNARCVLLFFMRDFLREILILAQNTANQVGRNMIFLCELSL